MELPFLNRTEELQRLRAALLGAAPDLVCLYGRRRLGKSALLRELLRSDRPPTTSATLAKQRLSATPWRPRSAATCPDSTLRTIETGTRCCRSGGGSRRATCH